ncbi:hypothetical protein BDW02DRAFT_594170 [Decorospora gaudefroyi]|uniref:Uncharacterized protein n=1 Tax=Decorospora gaudefroyi TaxID=184978 RepID=A0A6A5KKZ5_9PLEO|nr:hypothetical protein BDW02DRAFT_594170 [Decorospora gaudefroyi]
MVDENIGLIEATAQLTKKHDKFEVFCKTVKEKYDSEIETLKAEKGEKHFVEPIPPSYPEVNERTFFPLQCVYGADGVPTELIPPGAYDSNLQIRVPATLHAVMTLRPETFMPCFEAGKNGEQVIRGHGATLGTAGSDHSSMSITYAPREAPFVAAAADADNEPHAQVGFLTNTETSRFPIPTRASNKRAYNPSPTPQQLNQHAVHTRQTQAPKPVPNPPAAARRVAPAGTAEMDDELRIQWVQLKVKKDD